MTADNKNKLGIKEELIDFSGKIKCHKPCFISRDSIEENKGGQRNPFHWIVNVGGYPFVNICVQLRGNSGKYFQVQIRHHQPARNIGPTVTFVVASESGSLNGAGFELVTFNGIRPMLPELDIIVFSDNEEDFDKVAVSIYATVA